MIKRIVKLHFKASNVPKFIILFERSKDKIRNQEGCLYLELLQDDYKPEIFFTISTWRSEKDLEKYRNSKLFKEVWTITKALFEERAEAWTTKSVIDL